MTMSLPLQAYPVAKEQLQLVGVTAMLIASKYEEIYYPQVSGWDELGTPTYFTYCMNSSE